MTSPVISSGPELVEASEGCVLETYDDATGKPVPIGGTWKGTLTIGRGHTGPDVKPGMRWTQAQADAAFAVDYANAQRAAARDLGLDDWSKLDVCRQAALTDMAFEIGPTGLRGFTHMLVAVRQGNWLVAAQALQASELFAKVPARERRNITILLTGKWPSSDASPTPTPAPTPPEPTPASAAPVAPVAPSDSPASVLAEFFNASRWR